MLNFQTPTAPDAIGCTGIFAAHACVRSFGMHHACKTFLSIAESQRILQYQIRFLHAEIWYRYTLPGPSVYCTYYHTGTGTRSSTGILLVVPYILDLARSSRVYSATVRYRIVLASR